MTKKRRKMKEAGKPRHDEFDIYARAGVGELSYLQKLLEFDMVVLRKEMK